MASEIVNLWNAQLVEASSLSIVAGVPTDMLVSGDTTIDNQAGTIYNSIKVQITYADLMPGPNVLLNGHIGCVVEWQDVNGVWQLSPLSQFSSYRTTDQPSARVLVMQPNIDTFNLGTDDSLAPYGPEICRVSRVQGTLPEAYIRVRFIINENPQAANNFVSVKISGEAELYNV